jgi:hypothetical protein
MSRSEKRQQQPERKVESLPLSVVGLEPEIFGQDPPSVKHKRKVALLIDKTKDAFVDEGKTKGDELTCK